MSPNRGFDHLRGIPSKTKNAWMSAKPSAMEIPHSASSRWIPFAR
jgi:hypothetical protein